MKKIVSLLLVLAMLMSFATVSFADTVKSTQAVTISGKLATGGGSVKVSLKRDDSVVYMNKADVDENGNYTINFKYKGDISTVVALVEQEKENVSDTVISATAQAEPSSYAFDASETSAKVSEIKAGCSQENSIFAVLFYDADNKLISVQNGFGDVTTPGFAKSAKAYVYGKMVINLPLEAKIDDSQKIKVLAIGNSYAVDAYAYLEEIARKEGVYFDLRIAQMGGATFKKHWDVWNATTEEGRKKYTEDGEAVDIAHFLEDGTEYDYITIQQSSADSGGGSDYFIAMEEVAKYVRERQPKAEILIHKTWANEKGSPVTAFVNDYNSDQNYMTKQIDKSVETACKMLATVETDLGLKISLDGKPIRYIPAGDAFVIARQSEMFDTTYTLKANWNETHKYWEPEQINEAKVVSLHRDSYHCSHTYGRYLVALVWYRCLTGNSVLNNTYTNKKYPIPEEGRAIINAAAQKAVDDSGIWN